MERRSALLTLSGAVGLMTLPAWTNGWTVETVRPTRPLLAADLNELLADIAETFIPATDTPAGAVDGPGAKALNVHQFIQKIVADCYDKPAAETLQTGLNRTDELARKTFGKPFGEGDVMQRTALLTQMSQSTEPVQKEFYELVKGLTIRGYMNSEYVLTKLTHYELIPGRYHGCVPVVAKAVSQTK